MKPAVSLLLVDDDPVFRTVMSGELRRLGYAVATAGSGEEAIRETAALQPQVLLLDLRLPGVGGLDVLRFVRSHSPATDVIVLTGHGSIDTAIESIRMGAFDYVAKPCPMDELAIRIQRALERQSLERRATLLERGLTPPDPAGSLVGGSAKFNELLQLVERVALTASTVLITGETGSGKEMVAKLLHARSTRRARPFVVVECAALQETLLQSELFGHERGAFTGADRAKPGLFEVAHGGTIFLDEIGEISQATQVKLLRVIDTSTFRHVGGTAEVHVDVRIVAATNRDLHGMVQHGQFREDLYYRLSTISVTVPPLRDRREDIPLLVAHFVGMLNERYGTSRRVADSTLALIAQHDWPGNVRELQHAVEAAMAVCDGATVLPEHLPATLRPDPATPVGSAPPGGVPTLAQLEHAHVAAVLQMAEGHRGRAARLLGISERNLYRKLRDYGLG